MTQLIGHWQLLRLALSSVYTADPGYCIAKAPSVGSTSLFLADLGALAGWCSLRNDSEAKARNLYERLAENTSGVVSGYGRLI